MKNKYSLKKSSGAAVLIACLGIVVYSNSFFCSFHFDDLAYIINNPAIRNILNWPDIWDYWPCRFITFLSFALNYHFDQYHVFGYHVLNLGLHLATAILVWWLTLLTFSTPTMKNEKISRHADLIALMAGLIFVSHPIQTEAVTFIYQRTASMAAMFYVAALCLYVKSRAQEGSVSRLYYIGSLITALLAMFTKENTITLPLMIMLYEFCFLKTKKGFNWRGILPFLSVLLVLFLAMSITETGKTRLVLRGEPGIFPIHYLLTQFRVMVTYIRLMFFPLNQNFDYDYPVFKSIFEIPVLASLLFLAALLYFAKRLFLKYRIVSFSIFWFFLTLLPESSIIPIKDVIYEHRLYLPLAGYAIFLASSMYYLWGKNSARGMVMALTIVIACYSVLTYQRNKVWRDEITLWENTVAGSPFKARPFYDLGVAYDKQGNFAQAMFDYNKAIEINPRFADAHHNRGIIYYSLGDLDQALSDFNKAIENDPDGAGAYINRGMLYYAQGDLIQAMFDYNKAIEIDPNYSDVHINRGILYARQGDLSQAMSDFTKGVEINPDDAKAYYNRGLCFSKQGNLTQAIADYSRAIEKDPKYADAFYNRAVVYFQLKEYDKAWADVRKVQELGVTVQPQFIDALKGAHV